MSARDERGGRKRPAAVGDVIASVLKDAGLQDRVDQAAVIPEWPALVGPGIASVTEPLFVSADGTLFVAVKTNAWMTELSLLEPELLKAFDRSSGKRPRITRIRWQLKR